MQEVIGSIPFTSTSFSVELVSPQVLTLSSRGLGHHPFTVSTGVRIPVGSPDTLQSKSGTSGWHLARKSKRHLPGVVVQLVRIPACHAGGRGFESRPLRQYKKSLLSQRLRGLFAFRAGSIFGSKNAHSCLSSWVFLLPTHPCQWGAVRQLGVDTGLMATAPDVVNQSVLPSGAALATNCAATARLPPGRLSMMTLWLSSLPSCSPTARANMSDEPPGGKAMTSRTTSTCAMATWHWADNSSRLTKPNCVRVGLRVNPKEKSALTCSARSPYLTMCFSTRRISGSQPKP